MGFHALARSTTAGKMGDGVQSSAIQPRLAGAGAWAFAVPRLSCLLAPDPPQSPAARPVKRACGCFPFRRSQFPIRSLLSFHSQYGWCHQCSSICGVPAPPLASLERPASWRDTRCDECANDAGLNKMMTTPPRATGMQGAFYVLTPQPVLSLLYR